MKRVMLAIIILATGTALFCALHNASAVARQELSVQRTAWQTQTQQLARLYLEKQQVSEHITESKQLFASLPPLPALRQLEQKILAGDSLTNLTAAESEQLLAELGFNWNTTGDYLIVSKKSLDGISYDAMNGEKLSTAARGTLAINAAETSAIESMTGQLSKVRSAWVKEHVQRTEPSGDVVAQYSLPPDYAFAQNQLAIYTNGIMNALGEQRAQWLQNHSADWMMAQGLFTSPDMSKIPKEILATLPSETYQPQPTTMTVKRYNSGNDLRMNYTLEQGGNSMNTSVNPWQPFPEAFSALFPGGWKDLAEREGFALPAEFNKKN